MSEPHTFTGRGVDVYTMLVLANALRFYAKTGMKVNSAYTPMNMMTKARELLGCKIGARQYLMAAKLLTEKANGIRAELLASGEIK